MKLQAQLRIASPYWSESSPWPSRTGAPSCTLPWGDPPRPPFYSKGGWEGVYFACTSCPPHSRNMTQQEREQTPKRKARAKPNPISKASPDWCPCCWAENTEAKSVHDWPIMPFMAKLRGELHRETLHPLEVETTTPKPGDTPLTGFSNQSQLKLDWANLSSNFCQFQKFCPLPLMKNMVDSVGKNVVYLSVRLLS